MMRKEAIELAKEKLWAAGVPLHLFNVKAVPPYTEVSVLLSSGVRKAQLRSGVTRMELERALARG
jgi:hypothetical protein